MKTCHRLLLLVGWTLPLLGLAQVSSPAKRLESLDLAGRLLAPRENPAAALPPDLIDLFNPSRPTQVKAPTPRANSASDRELLQKIVEKIKPSGMLMLRGEPLLLFREKKLKVGDTLNIAFEGADYVLVITAIDQTSYRISLNHEEITRPIKN